MYFEWLPTSNSEHDDEKKKVGVLSLDIIRQAAFVLECFEKKITVQELVDAIKGESALAKDGRRQVVNNREMRPKDSKTP